MDRQAIIKALRDTAQSASNTAATNVSMPIDGIAWALRKAGLDVQNPVGGSDWMAQQGLTIPVQEGIPKMIGETAGGLIPAAMFAKVPKGF